MHLRRGHSKQEETMSGAGEETFIETERDIQEMRRQAFKQC